jgi:hypothetical protein
VNLAAQWKREKVEVNVEVKVEVKVGEKVDVKGEESE